MIHCSPEHGLVITLIIQSDYYSLSVVNCDREQEALLKSGQNPAQCPKACEVGVVHIGSECAVAFNLDYIKNQSAMYGSNFKLEEFDQLGTAALCGVELPEDKKRESYASGQMSFLLNSVGGQLVDCDTQKLLSADFIALKAKCDGTEGELCDPSCQTAIDEVSFLNSFDIIEQKSLMISQYWICMTSTSSDSKQSRTKHLSQLKGNKKANT